MSHSNEVESETVDRVSLSNDLYKMPSYCMLHNYLSLHKLVSYITGRTYERPHKWYFLTFTPFNSTYTKNLDFYTNKCLDHCRKKLGKVEAYIITREIKATKIHINVLCVTKRDLSKELHKAKTNRYFIYCEECRDRNHCLDYILKESKTRYFKQYVDYVSHAK